MDHNDSCSISEPQPKNIIVNPHAEEVVSEEGIVEENIKLPRDMVVERGKMQFDSLNYHVLVLAEGWPSWAFAIVGLKFESVAILTEGAGLSTMLELEETAISQWLSKTSYQDWLEEHKDHDKLLLAQGTSAFLDGVEIPDIDDDSFVYIFACSGPTWRAEEHITLSHEQVGGVTNGKFAIIARGAELNANRLSSNVRRRLRHVMDPVNTGSPRSLLESLSTVSLTENDLVPFGSTSVKCHVPTVFGVDRKVDRVLSVKELMSAYDIEHDTQLLLNKYWDRENFS